MTILLTPPWSTASAVSQFPCEQALQRRVDAVERLAERLAAEEAGRLVLHLERADERGFELLRWDRVEPPAAPLGEFGPQLDLAAGRDDLGRLARAWQIAGDDEVECGRRERVASGGRLLTAAGRQRYVLRLHRRSRLVDVRHLGVPHQDQPASHSSYFAR